MKKHSNKQLDKLARKALKDLPLETPSSDFTHDVMKQIEQLPLPVVSAYKPLISGPVWMVLGAILVGSIFLAYQFKLGSGGWFSNLDIWKSNAEELSLTIPSMEWSNPLLYATLILGLLIFVQIRLLKPLLVNRSLA
ncbi:MAG: hypothetical protein KJO49_08910 [Bacteroidia bacterium]|nr:hypothetical protein [Bacteroidia bacterium]MBT8269917.1 hypothetical protein [Bacteroidia bacterium]NNF81811.1 hypothetical protein [Flavobacteriaceae bacterium]NNK71456.1 hypothetical protein [Flavobacteriaceae bacterium]NNL80977.1 hypothetical protein [Flavobacteriaceae bacterium]